MGYWRRTRDKIPWWLQGLIALIVVAALIFVAPGSSDDGFSPLPIPVPRKQAESTTTDPPFLTIAPDPSELPTTSEAALSTTTIQPDPTTTTSAPDEVIADPVWTTLPDEPVTTSTTATSLPATD